MSCSDCIYNIEARCPVKHCSFFVTDVFFEGEVLSCETLNLLYDALIEVQQKRKEVKNDK